jgi:hypothetical protein
MNLLEPVRYSFYSCTELTLPTRAFISLSCDACSFGHSESFSDKQLFNSCINFLVAVSVQAPAHLIVHSSGDPAQVTSTALLEVVGGFAAQRLHRIIQVSDCAAEPCRQQSLMELFGASTFGFLDNIGSRPQHAVHKIPW